MTLNETLFVCMTDTNIMNVDQTSYNDEATIMKDTYYENMSLTMMSKDSSE